MCEPFAAAIHRLEKEATDDVLLAFLGEKKLEHWRRVGDEPEWVLKACHGLSSGKNPPSCLEGSGGTPWGLHEVAEKFGGGEEPGTVFTGRVSTGERYDQRTDYGPEQRMLVTTRILRLRGLEEGLNAGAGVDSFDRYIYLHGTTRPADFPRNQSGGCLVVLDEPLLQLYDEVPAQSLVWIER